MTDAQQYSDSLAAAVEKAARGTVSVDARGRLPATGVIWSAQGEILTADHVVQRDDNINVILPDGTTHTATVLGRDPGSDLALLKIDASGLSVPELAEGLKVGHLVFAVGRPDDVQATLGSVVQGDVLVGLGRQAVAEIGGRQAALSGATVGQTSKVKLVRGGEVKELTVTVGGRE